MSCKLQEQKRLVANASINSLALHTGRLNFLFLLAILIILKIFNLDNSFLKVIQMCGGWTVDYVRINEPLLLHCVALTLMSSTCTCRCSNISLSVVKKVIFNYFFFTSFTTYICYIYECLFHVTEYMYVIFISKCKCMSRMFIRLGYKF